MEKALTWKTTKERTSEAYSLFHSFLKNKKDLWLAVSVQVLDYGSTWNQGILYYSDNPTLDEIAIRLSCSFLHIVTVDNLKQ